MNNNLFTSGVLVFATDVTNTREANNVLVSLLLHPGVRQANFDLEDTDSILRVVSCGISEREIERLLARHHLWCKALA
ncbi:hypothetical protein [Sinomicrobium soli]|uniref:hypothetical protein n=1 Tax=Sinomicrobium sp. N-1-3-6 TaxID=2219864 RepID=UPI000DCB23EA|nr:hypothetical protein [Sinomicrobium sp. N-1-3-6]RAV30777.1 hypothetical protein DN748_00515 [Sinomicrobium sp. N-1-3-6]